MYVIKLVYVPCKYQQTLVNALKQAVVEGNISAIDSLREKINQVTEKEGSNVLLLASKFGKTACMQFILAEFADENFLVKADKKQRTALHRAAKRGHNDCVELLISAARGSSSIDFEKFIRQADCNGNTALHMAVRNNRVEVVKLIFNADPDDSHSLNDDSRTPLYIAADWGYKDIVEVICESCTSPSFDGQGKTALHAAVVNGDTDSVRVILNKRGDLVLSRDSGGWTATDYVASRNFVSLLDILVKTENNQFDDYLKYKQFFIDRPDKETALHRAAFNGSISTVLQLTKLYPDFIWSAVNGHGQNILHIAVHQNHEQLGQGIVQYCPNLSLVLNEKDKNGNTPLHLLVMRGCFIRELIKHEGVGRNAKNNNNFTPYDLLYHDEDIIADQLKVKEALEDSEFINQRWNYGLRKSNPELITAESPVFPSTRSTKDTKFKKARDLLIKEEIKLYRLRINTQIIVTALITTVTFTVGFTMQGGYHQSGEVDEGSALLSEKTAFNVFMLADTLALLLSMSSLALYFVASMYQDAEEISKLVDASTLLNIVSVVATTLTFVMGIYLVLSHSSVLVISVSVMSGFFFLLIILLMITVLKDPIEKFRE